MSVAADVPPSGWSEPVEMRYENRDTVNVRSLRLSLLHSAAAVHSEGRFVLWRVSPSGSVTSDTLRIAIEPDPRGGNRLAEAQAAPTSAPLVERGEYRFSVAPLQNMAGVWSVGLTLSSTE